MNGVIKWKKDTVTSHEHDDKQTTGLRRAYCGRGMTNVE